MIRLLIILLVGLSASAQTWNQADSLTNLLTRPPVVGGWYSVKGYRVAGDWGGERTAQYVRGDTTSTNLGNVFNWSVGRLKFFDATNSLQDLRWWNGGPSVTDNTPALTNAANWVVGLGGGYVYADVGTHSFLSSNTITMPSGARLKGAGPNASTFNWTSATPASDYIPMLRWIGDLSSGVGISTSTVAGGTSLVLDAPTDWAVGDQLQIRQTNYFSFGGRKFYSAGEFNFVASIVGGTNITLRERLEASYPTVYTRVAKVVPAVGSVEGVHFALGPKWGGVTLDYCDGRSYFKNCSGAGTEESHFNIRRSYGLTVSDLFVDWDSEPVGQNYGLIVGDSEYVNVQNCFLRSGRAGFDAGGSTIPTRYLTVSGTTMGSTRTSSHGAGLHEDVVESTFENCVFLSGVSLGGGRNRLLNSIVKNNTDRASVAVPAGRYYDWEVRGNQIECAVDPTLGVVYGLRMYLQAGSQGTYPESTNYWPGTFGGTENQSIRITDNQFRVVGVVTNSQFPGVFIDEASTVTANTNIAPAMFGRLEIARNQFLYDPAQPASEITSAGVVVQQGSKIRWPETIITENLFASGPPTINLNGGKLMFRNNTVQNSYRKEGVYIYPVNVAWNWSPIDVVIDGNTWLTPLGSAFFVANTGGRLVVRNNRSFDHGEIADVSYKFAFRVSETTTNVFTDIEFDNNLVSSTNAPSYDLYVYSASSPFREYGTQRGESTTRGSVLITGGYLNVPRLQNAYGSTNAIALLGQYTALPTASSYPPGLAHSAGDLWYSDGIGWTNFMHAGVTAFPSLYVTNNMSASNIVATGITLRNDGSRVVGTVPGTYPIYVLSNTNDAARIVIDNQATTGSAAQSFFQANAYGGLGYFGATSTNNSSGNFVARAFLKAVSGNGLTFDLTYPNSMDMVYTYGGGVEFARLSTNIFSLPAVATLAPTSTVSHVAIFDTDPSASTRRQIKSMTPANLKNALAITAADITDSTAAGRALLTAVDAAAQRTSLGLGTLATVNDAPSDGNQYVRSNASWAIASGGGGTPFNGFGVYSASPGQSVGMTNLVLLGNAQITLDHDDFQPDARIEAILHTKTLASFKAQDGEPPAANYATFSTRNGIGVMLFDPSVEESMRYRFLMPTGWAGTNVTVLLTWTTTLGSDTARWGAKFMRMTGDIDTDSFGPATEVSHNPGGSSGTIQQTTLSGVDLDGTVSGEWAWLSIYRDVSDAADTLDTVDLELHGVEIRAE